MLSLGWPKRLAVWNKMTPSHENIPTKPPLDKTRYGSFWLSRVYKHLLKLDLNSWPHSTSFLTDQNWPREKDMVRWLLAAGTTKKDATGRMKCTTPLAERSSKIKTPGLVDQKIDPNRTCERERASGSYKIGLLSSKQPSRDRGRSLRHVPDIKSASISPLLLYNTPL